TARYADAAFAARVLYTVVKRIFYQRLEGQLRQDVKLQMIGDIYLIFHQVPVTHFLDLEIAADVLFLLGQRDNVPAPAQGKPEEVGQRTDHGNGIRDLTRFDQPYYRVQGVV